MPSRKNISWAIVAAAFIIAFAIVFTTYSIQSPNHDSDSNDTAQNEGNLSGDVNLNNNVENNIDGENAEVTNNIENKVEKGEHVNLDNNIINNIDVAVDVQLSNNVDNDVNEKGENRNNDESNEDRDDSNNADNNGDGSGENDNSNDDNGSNDNSNGDSNGNNNNEDENNNETTDENVWGVDSVNVTDQGMMSCVNENFGEPKVWGRYLVDKDGVSSGLTQEEVDLLHEQDIRILVVWNHFENATGYDNGYNEANEAIQAAKDFNIPEGVALFADVEPIYPADSAFLNGWYDAINESEYEAGIYGVFDPEQAVYTAFEAAAKENEALLDDMYIWTASPNIGITTEANAPEYNPDAPEDSSVLGWQYGLDAQTCNIDTNWFNGEHLDVLW